MSKTLEKAISILRSREEAGIKKYGRSLDDCPDGHYDWKMEVIEELLDALMYSSKEISRLETKMKTMVSKTLYESDY